MKTSNVPSIGAWLLLWCMMLQSGQASAQVNQQRTFTGQALQEIAFPLGGIGTGCVSLGGRGDLRDLLEEVAAPSLDSLGLTLLGDQGLFFA